MDELERAVLMASGGVYGSGGPSPVPPVGIALSAEGGDPPSDSQLDPAAIAASRSVGW